MVSNVYLYPIIYLDLLIASIAIQVKYCGEPGPTPTINKFFCKVYLLTTAIVYSFFFQLMRMKVWKMVFNHSYKISRFDSVKYTYHSLKRRGSKSRNLVAGAESKITQCNDTRIVAPPLDSPITPIALISCVVAGVYHSSGYETVPQSVSGKILVVPLISK